MTDLLTSETVNTPPGDRFRIVTAALPWLFLPCKLCGSAAELWQRWHKDDIWHSFGACSNLEDVDGEPCIFHLPPEPFYHERKADAVRYWNLMMGPRVAIEEPPKVAESAT